MTRLVVIMTEKPSAARNFAKALGGVRGTYDGESYVVVNALGHLFELASPEKQVPADLVARYKSWDVSHLPWDESAMTWRREKKKDAASFLKDIKAALAGADEVCIGGDVDPSGEGYLIQAEILQELKVRPKKLTRMYFTDEAPASIQKAFKTRKVIPALERDREYLMAWYRTRWDFLSMQFTRVATAFGDGRSVLRQGRLKSAMVLLVGDQLRLLAGYKKVPFYQNKFRDDHGVIYTNPEEPVFPDKGQVPRTYHASDVVVDGRTMKSKAPPKFLDLASLSATLASRGHKAKDVLAVYQKMYEAQVVSYPRTEDKVVTPEQFDELLPLVDRIAAVVGVDPSVLTHRRPRSTHVKTGGAHGANRPGTNVPASLGALAQYGSCAAEIYEILARNYLACMAEDYEYESQRGHVKDYPKFVGTASVPKRAGWKVVFSDQDDDEEDENASGLGSVAEPFVHEGFPPKPATPTMRWLMRQLETRDVGTGATRTSTYSEVTSDRAKFPLMVDKRGRVTLSEYGEMSYRLLPGTHIGDLKLTERVQAQMRDIADGKLRPEDCLREIQDMIRDDVVTMAANGRAMREELGKTMADFAPKEKFAGVWSGMPVSFNRVFRGRRVEDDECEALCRGETVTLGGIRGKNGEYAADVRLNNLEYNGHKYVGIEFVGFASRGGRGVPDAWCGHRFSDAERQTLQAGGAVKVTDAVSKRTGKKFACRLTWDANKGVEPHFDVIPTSWGGHTFTADEMTMLEAGSPVKLENMTSKKTGKTYSCTVRYGDKPDGSGKGIIAEF